VSYQISVLDKSPVAEGASPEQALRNSLRWRSAPNNADYHRYWFAEHHAAPTLASPAPEVLAAWVLAQTRRIRIGSGGVMLRHYAPYKVAENFNLLAALAPGASIWAWARPGGLPASTAALAAGRPPFADFDQQLRDLEGYLAGAESEALARPVPQQAPERFLLGASPQSAKQAAELGWRFVYAAHFDGDPKHIEAAFDAYRSVASQPPLLATVAFAAPTAEAAARHRCAARLQAAPRSRAGGEPAQPRGGCRVRARWAWPTSASRKRAPACCPAMRSTCATNWMRCTGVSAWASSSSMRRWPTSTHA
jgi:luciferase family oxidoreductase group 1